MEEKQMTYIINPMWFYWLSVADRACQLIRTAAILLFVFSVGFLIVVAFCRHIVFDCDECSKGCSEYKAGGKVQRVAIVLFVVAVILFIIHVFIPSRETLIEMQIARFTTVENAEWVLDAVKSATDYIVSAIKELQ